MKNSYNVIVTMAAAYPKVEENWVVEVGNLGDLCVSQGDFPCLFQVVASDRAVTAVFGIAAVGVSRTAAAAAAATAASAAVKISGRTKIVSLSLARA